MAVNTVNTLTGAGGSQDVEQTSGPSATHESPSRAPVPQRLWVDLQNLIVQADMAAPGLCNDTDVESARAALQTAIRSLLGQARDGLKQSDRKSSEHDDHPRIPADMRQHLFRHLSLVAGNPEDEGIHDEAVVAIGKTASEVQDAARAQWHKPLPQIPWHARIVNRMPWLLPAKALADRGMAALKSGFERLASMRTEKAQEPVPRHAKGTDMLTAVSAYLGIGPSSLEDTFEDVAASADLAEQWACDRQDAQASHRPHLFAAGMEWQDEQETDADWLLSNAAHRLLVKRPGSMAALTLLRDTQGWQCHQGDASWRLDPPTLDGLLEPCQGENRLRILCDVQVRQPPAARS